MIYLTLRHGVRLPLALLLAALLVPSADAAATNEENRAVIGQPAALAVWPEVIHLSGPRAMQQIMVTGRYADGAERDLTPFCDIGAEDGSVVSVGPGGFLQPRRAGRTMLVVRAGAITKRVPVVVELAAATAPAVSFRHQMIAALNVAGCNAGACHGIPSGRGGFKLSLRGYDPASDYRELTREMLGRRSNRIEAESSLIYLKGLGRVPHEGGQRFSADSVPAEIMRAWLKEGMRDDAATLPALTKVEVKSGSGLLIAPARMQQLAVQATFADGSVRDVTRLTVFSSSDEGIARVDRNGLVELLQTGEAAILCRYLDNIQCVRLIYVEPRKDFRWPDAPERNYVDRHVFAKLKMLNIAPSELCSDEVFLRRAFLDLCGILPTAAEAQRFQADRAPDKRAQLIDQLLARPEYADFWTHKWLDLLRANRKTIQIRGSNLYRFWLRGHFEGNTRWDQVVRELLSASGSTFDNAPTNFFRGTYNSAAPVAIRDPHSLAEATSQLFFGIRMQCAQCHNHPYERWTQDDYHHLAAWFSQVKAKADPHNPGIPRTPYAWQLREDAIIIYPTFTGEVTRPGTGQLMVPKIMGMPAPVIPANKDRRQVLAELVTSPANPFFARAMVNRIWFQLLGRGIVDPPDDFRDSNPSANDALLDALARDFVEHQYDVKHIIRTIVHSRTYQLSSHANASNKLDDKYFSHALVMRKRLSAEVLFDAICAVTELPETFANTPAGARAVQLPDGEVINTGGRYAGWDRHPFMKAFGQPARETVCDCEREGDVSLARVLEMKNGDFLQKKIHTPDNRLGKLLARKLPNTAILDELFLTALSRPPLPHEAQAALSLVEQSADKREAWEAVLWALLNTNEFLFRY